MLIRYGDHRSESDVIARADPAFLEMFTFPLIRGNAVTALDDVSSIVITSSLASKLFGDEDPMGKIMSIEQRDVVVTGIMHDLPVKSHLQFDALVPHRRGF